MSHSTDHRCDVSETHSDGSFSDSFRRCFATVLVALIIILALTGAAGSRDDTIAGPVPLPKLAGSGGTVESAVSDSQVVRHDANDRGVRTGLWHATFREQEVRQDVDDESVPADDTVVANGDRTDSEPARLVVDSMFPADDSVQEEVLLSSGEEQPGLPSRVPSLSAIEIEATRSPAEVPEQLPTGPSNVTVIVLLLAAILSVGLMTSR